MSLDYLSYLRDEVDLLENALNLLFVGASRILCSGEVALSVSFCTDFICFPRISDAFAQLPSGL